MKESCACGGERVLVFDVYFTYQLHTNMKLTAKAMSYESKSELALHPPSHENGQRTLKRKTCETGKGLPILYTSL